MSWFFHKERGKGERAGEKESKNEELGGSSRSWQRWKKTDLRKKWGIEKNLDRNMFKKKKTNLRAEFMKEIATFKKKN